jgi:AraC family transcriptional regulator
VERGWRFQLARSIPIEPGCCHLCHLNNVGNEYASIPNSIDHRQEEHESPTLHDLITNAVCSYVAAIEYIKISPRTKTMKNTTMTARSRSVDVFTLQVPAGDWEKTPLKHVSLTLARTTFAAHWQGKAGFHSANFGPGDISTCEYGTASPHLLDRPAPIGIIVVSDEVMREVSQETRADIPLIQSHPLIRDPVLSHLAQAIMYEGQNHFQNGSLFSDSLATALGHYLWKRYPSSASIVENTVGGMAPLMLRRCIEYVHANLESDIRLADLAREAGMSRSHLIRTFRQSTGKTPHQFLLEQRIEKARMLIRQGGLSLTGIALTTGFANQHHLARIFRRVTGMTPSQFRLSL